MLKMKEMVENKTDGEQTEGMRALRSNASVFLTELNAITPYSHFDKVRDSVENQ